MSEGAVPRGGFKPNRESPAIALNGIIDHIDAFSRGSNPADQRLRFLQSELTKISALAKSIRSRIKSGDVDNFTIEQAEAFRLFQIEELAEKRVEAERKKAAIAREINDIETEEKRLRSLEKKK